MLDTVNITLTITRRDNPYLVSAFSKVNRKSLGDRWNTADHWRILISNDHYTHVYRSFPAIISLMGSNRCVRTCTLPVLMETKGMAGTSPATTLRIPRVCSGSNVVAGLVPPGHMIPAREPSQASYM